MKNDREYSNDGHVADTIDRTECRGDEAGRVAKSMAGGAAGLRSVISEHLTVLYSLKSGSV